MEIFQDIEGLVFKPVEIYVEIQDMEIILEMEAHHHCTTISRKLISYGI